MYRANPLAVVANEVIPLLYVAVDYDDATVPIVLGTLREYENVIARDDAHAFMVQIRPHAALAAYNGGFGGFANVSNPWIDCNSNNVQHYGAKYAIDVGAAGQTNLQTWNVSCRYYFSFRNVR